MGTHRGAMMHIYVYGGCIYATDSELQIQMGLGKCDAGEYNTERGNV